MGREESRRTLKCRASKKKNSTKTSKMVGAWAHCAGAIRLPLPGGGAKPLSSSSDWPFSRHVSGEGFSPPIPGSRDTQVVAELREGGGSRKGRARSAE